MTFPPDDQGERPGGPWSQRPQHPPPYQRASYPRHPDQPGYPPAEPGYGQAGYDEPGYPPLHQPGYPDTGYPRYQGSDDPGYPSDGPPGYRAPGAPGGTRPGAMQGTSRQASATSNTPSFTGLTLGILGLLASFLAPLLAIGFGIAGLVRSRRAGQRGGAMAITGILLGVMWIAVTVLFAMLVIHDEQYGSVAALRAGSCFDNAQPGHIAVRVRYLPSCTGPHNGEVVGTFALPATAWPGQQAVSREAATGCAQLLTSVLGQQTLSGGVRGMNYSPDQQAWSAGTRAVSCVLLDPSATHTGSMLSGN